MPATMTPVTIILSSFPAGSPQCIGNRLPVPCIRPAFSHKFPPHNKSPTRYTTKVITQATANWNRAENSIHFVLPDSLRIVANAAAHGTYRRQNTIRQNALSVPKPEPPKIPASVFIPAPELILGTPKRNQHPLCTS